MVAEPHLRQSCSDERPDLELGTAGRARRGDEQLEHARRVGVVARLVQSLGAGERAFEPTALVGRDTAREEPRVDAETCREPFERLARRPRLAALDLGDVLLLEAIAGKVALREPGLRTELPEPLSEPDRLSRRGACLGRFRSHLHA